MQNTSLFKGRRIGKHGVMVRRHERQRSVRHDGVQIVTRRLCAGGDDVIVGRNPHDQRIVRPPCRIAQNRIFQPIQPTQAHQVKHVQLGRPRKQMHMAVDKSGQNGAAMGINHAGSRSNQALNVGIAANCGDLATGNCKGLCRWT